MTTVIEVRVKSNGTLKYGTHVPTGQEGKYQVMSERLIMNRDPVEITVNNGEFLVFEEAQVADDQDAVAAFEAAAKEPQKLEEQRNPQAAMQPGFDPTKNPQPTASARKAATSNSPVQEASPVQASTEKTLVPTANTNVKTVAAPMQDTTADPSKAASTNAQKAP